MTARPRRKRALHREIPHEFVVSSGQSGHEIVGDTCNGWANLFRG